MALTRDYLKSLGIEGMTGDVIQGIMDEHGDTVETNKRAAEEALNAAKAERDARADIKPEDLVTLRSELETAQATAKSFEGIDVAALQTSVAEAQNANESMRAQHAEQINTLQADALLREVIAPIHFASAYERSGVYENLKGKITYTPGENGAAGTISGHEEVIEELRGRTSAENKDTPGTAGGVHRSGRRQTDDSASLKEALTQKYKT